MLPVPGRPEGSRDYGRFARFPFTWRRSRSGSGAGGRRALGRGAGDAQRFVFGSHPDVAIARRSPRFVKLRDLAERQVLREAPGGKALDRAGQQGEEGPPGRVGNCGPASEIHGNTGAAQGAFEQARVKLGSAQENTNAVERNAAAPFFENAPRDFDALSPFARRREKHDLLRILRCLARGGLRQRKKKCL